MRRTAFPGLEKTRRPRHCAPRRARYMRNDATRAAEHTMTQPSLFSGEAASLPEGLSYRADLVTPAEERALTEEFTALAFREFEFHGFHGKRRVVSFGWQYDFNGGGLRKADDMPAFLLPL